MTFFTMMDDLEDNLSTFLNFHLYLLTLLLIFLFAR